MTKNEKKELKTLKTKTKTKGNQKKKKKTRGKENISQTHDVLACIASIEH